MKFGTDGDGNYGYYGADGSLIPFKSIPTFTYIDGGKYKRAASYSYTLEKGIYIVSISNGGASYTNYGENTIIINDSNAKLIGNKEQSVLSTTDSSYTAWCGMNVGIVIVTGSSSMITCKSKQGNHSTGMIVSIVKIF